MGVLSRSELVFVLTVLAVLLILLIFFVIPRAGGGAFVVAFSDRGDINGDGKGEYIDGLDNLRIGDRGNLFMAQLSGETSRYVYIRFEDMSWRDEDLKPVDPQLPSSQYQLVLMIYLHGATLRTMDVGLSYEPSIWIVAVDTGQNASYGLLRSPVELSDVRFFTLNSTPATPPPQLYNVGYAHFTRVEENRWVFEADAWFLLLKGTEEYYVKLSFETDIEYRKL